MKINNYLDHYILCAALSYISTHTAAGMCAQASQFPPDYNDAGSYLFSPAVRLFFLSLLLVAEIAAFTDDRQFESALVE